MMDGKMRKVRFYAGMIVPTLVCLWKKLQTNILWCLHHWGCSLTLDCFSNRGYSFRSWAAHSLRLDFFFFLESNTSPNFLARLTTPLTFLCCDKSQCVHTTWVIMIAHSPTYRISQPRHQQKSFSYFLIPPFLCVCYSSLFFFLANFPSSPFLCAFHLYLTTMILQHLFYPWLHGRQGKRKRKKDNERKKALQWFPHLLSFL